MGEAEGKVLLKSYFDVLGLCCSSEVPLIEKIVQPLKGVQKVTVIVPSRTVIVVHDSTLISQLDIVKALNQARLEASIRAYGNEKISKKWPSPYILACGVLLLVSLFKCFFLPLQWLALAAVVVGVPPILLRSIAAIRNYTLDINILMVIAVAGAIALRDYSEAGFIVFLFTIAEWLESRAGHKATAGMSLLMSMAPQKAVLAETGQVVDVQNVKISTVLAVKAGEVIPIDGIVMEGRSEVDESSLTGESFPVTKQAESLVWAGTLNIDGYISVRATALAENSTVAKMARLVEEAQNSRSKTQRLIDSCTKYYTPAVVIIAGAVAVIPLILRVHNQKHWFQFSLVLLVSACPCALVLSTPVATFCALLKAARTGLLVKGGDVLEDLAKTRVVALDKTGTITKGEFTIMEFQLISHEVTMDKLIYWVSSIESKSSHPMASALVGYARSNSIEPKPENVNDFRIYPGEGIYGEIEGKNIYVGNKRIVGRAGCSTVPYAKNMKEGVTLGYAFSGAVPIGIFTLSDTCRTGALEAIKQLKSLGIKTAMLTGDSNAAAMHVQNQLGNAIELIHAELLPEDKVRIVSDLKAKEGPTIMIGDGLNDAPALAMANVGISMGIAGSAVAMETSHITLMSNDIRKIPKAIQLARRTHRKIIVNIIFSLITKIAILALAIAGHPILWAAALADVGTCLVVIFNSMMLLQTRASKEKHCHSSYKAHGQCCNSSEKSHTHKTACVDHCGHGCGSAAAGGHSKCASHLHGHSCHDHEKVEKERACKSGYFNDHKAVEKEEASRNKCIHDHGAEKEERAHHNCSSHEHKTAEKGACKTKCSHEHESGKEERAHHNCSSDEHKTAEKGACKTKCSHENGSGKEEKAHNNCSSHDHKTVEIGASKSKCSHDHGHVHKTAEKEGACKTKSSPDHSHDHRTAQKEGDCKTKCSHDHKREEKEGACKTKSSHGHSQGYKTAEKEGACKTKCGHDHGAGKEEKKLHNCSSNDHKTADKGACRSKCSYDQGTGREERAPHNNSSHDHKASEKEACKTKCSHEHGVGKEEGACKSNPCHEHKAAETETGCKSKFSHDHDHGAGKEERALHKCLSTCKSNKHQMNLLVHSHYDQEPDADTSNARHEHLISITDGVECCKDGLHEDHSGEHVACCHKGDAAQASQEHLISITDESESPKVELHEFNKFGFL